jgi:hypothetical protein
MWMEADMFGSTGGMSGEQRDALLRLVDGGVLTPAQGVAVRAALGSAPGPRRRSAGWLVEVAGYIGGGLMLGGAALFLIASWDELSRAARSGLLAVFALAFAVGGVLVAGGPWRVRRRAPQPGTARRRIVGVLFGLAALPAALAMGVAVDHHAGLSGALVGFAVAVLGMLLVPTAAGLVVTAAMSVAAVALFGDEVLHASPLGSGLLLIALGLAWTMTAWLGLVPARPLGLVVGTAVALIGAQLPLGTEGTVPWAYALTFGLALGCFLGYRWQRSVVFLVAGVLGVTVAVPEAVIDWTDGAVGGSVVLLLAGAVLVAASAVGLGIRHRSTQPPAGRRYGHPAAIRSTNAQVLWGIMSGWFRRGCSTTGRKGSRPTTTPSTPSSGR